MQIAVAAARFPPKVIPAAWLDALTEESRVHQSELARRLGVDVGTVSRWKRHPRGIPRDRWLDMLEASGMPPDWEPGPARPSTMRVVSNDDDRVVAGAFRTLLPLFSVQAACGAFTGGQHVEPEGWVEAPQLARDGRFVVRARGDSMEPRIRDGDYVVLERRPDGAPLPENNPVVLVEYDDGAKRAHAIKQISVVPEPFATPQNPRRVVTLLSTNPEHPPIAVRDAGVTVVGTFVGVILPPE